MPTIVCSWRRCKGYEQIVLVFPLHHFTESPRQSRRGHRVYECAKVEGVTCKPATLCFCVLGAEALTFFRTRSSFFARSSENSSGPANSIGFVRFEIVEN